MSMQEQVLKMAVKSIKPFLSQIGNSIDTMRGNFEAKNLKIIIANKFGSDGLPLKDEKGNCIPYMAYIDHSEVDLKVFLEHFPEHIEISKGDMKNLLRKYLAESLKYIQERDQEGNLVYNPDGKPKPFVKNIDGLVTMMSS